MLKVLTLVVALSGLAVTVKAAEGDKPAKPQLTEEQKKERQAIIDKYDKNKDGKLDGEERKSVSAEDKEKMQKLMGRGQKKSQ
jgi:hypothetical protein